MSRRRGLVLVGYGVLLGVLLMRVIAGFSLAAMELTYQAASWLALVVIGRGVLHDIRRGRVREVER